MNQVPLSPRVSHRDRFEFFQKFAEIFASQEDRFEFFRKFAEIFASQDAPLVSTTPVANFATSFASVVDTGGKFASGATTQVVHLELQISLQIFEKIQNGPNGRIRSLGETDP
jgi:hypothetical protein